MYTLHTRIQYWNNDSTFTLFICVTICLQKNVVDPDLCHQMASLDLNGLTQKTSKTHSVAKLWGKDKGVVCALKVPSVF